MHCASPAMGAGWGWCWGGILYRQTLHNRDRILDTRMTRDDRAGVGAGTVVRVGAGQIAEYVLG